VRWREVQGVGDSVKRLSAPTPRAHLPIVADVGPIAVLPGDFVGDHESNVASGFRVGLHPLEHPRKDRSVDVSVRGVPRCVPGDVRATDVTAHVEGGDDSDGLLVDGDSSGDLGARAVPLPVPPSRSSTQRAICGREPETLPPPPV